MSHCKRTVNNIRKHRDRKQHYLNEGRRFIADSSETMEVDNNDNSDDDYEEEEFLVFLDFQSKIKSETLEKRNLQIKMIGFDTDEPIVQVNNKIFRGKK